MLELISVSHLFHISDKLFPCMIVLSFYFINYYNVHFFGFWISRLRWFQFAQKMNFRNLIPFHLRNARNSRFLFLFQQVIFHMNYCYCRKINTLGDQCFLVILRFVKWLKEIFCRLANGRSQNWPSKPREKSIAHNKNYS